MSHLKHLVRKVRASMLDRKNEQSQQVTDGSAAIQAARDVVFVSSGLSYGDVRDVALDIFRSNFMQLVGEAKDAATKRAEEITEKFLLKLQQENAEGMEQVRTPDFQYGLYTVQKEYARTADDDLGDLLVDLLVDRTKHPGRDMLQIVLNESLSVASKLTSNQLAALSVIFFLKYCSTSGVLTLAKLGEQFDEILKPFVGLLPVNSVSFQHLQYAGCGSIQMGSVALEDVLWGRYQGLFVRGFKPAALSGCTFFFNQGQQLIGKSPYDPTKEIVRAQNSMHLDQLLEAYHVPSVDSDRVRAAFVEGRLSSDEIRGKCVELRSYLQDLFDLWNKTDLHNFSLTSVGMALGHANIKRLTGFADLSIWVQ